MMSECVLFSPVGTTDPVRDDYEGALLHIIRHYKPGVVYLYITKEMEIRSRADDRFVSAIRRQAKQLGRDPESIKIECLYSGIEDPSDFDIFEKDYHQAFLNISEAYPSAQTLVNISSGTPQMIATACLLVASRYKNLDYKAVQVVNPKGKSGEKSRYIDQYHDELVVQVLDYDPDAENRCVEPNITFFMDSMLREKLVELINNYDYASADRLIDTAPAAFGEAPKRWVRHMTARAAFDFVTAKRVLTEDDMMAFDPYPVKNSRVKPLYEYYLGIMIRYLRQDWNPYIMKLSPFLTELIRFYIQEVKKYHLLDKIIVRQNGGWKFRIDLMQKHDPRLLSYLDQNYNGQFKPDYLMLSNLLNVLKFLDFENINNRPETKAVITQFETLRKAEENLRNVAAHQMISVSDDWIKDNTGQSIHKLHEELQVLFGKIVGTYCGEGWQTLPERASQHILMILDGMQ